MENGTGCPVIEGACVSHSNPPCPGSPGFVSRPRRPRYAWTKPGWVGSDRLEIGFWHGPGAMSLVRSLVPTSWIVDLAGSHWWDVDAE